MCRSLFLFLMTAALAAAQTNQTFYVSATTKDDQPVSISSDQCRVAARLSINKIEKLGAVPISYVVAIDTSKSTQELFRAEVSAAKLLLKEVVRPQVDKGFVVAFDIKYKMTGISSNPNELANFVDSLQPFGGTAVYQAIHASTERLVSGTPDTQPRVIFLISDGEDNGSAVKPSDVKKELMRAGVRLYPISLSEPGILSRGEKWMKEVAEETGGALLRPRSKDKFLDMEKPVLLLRGDLSSWYRVELSVPSGEKPGSTHSMHLQCGEKSMQLRAPSSYIAGP